MLAEWTNSRPAGDVLVQVARDSGVGSHRQIEIAIRDGILGYATLDERTLIPGVELLGEATTAIASTSIR